MSDLYIPGQFRGECDAAMRAFQAVTLLLDAHKVDEADTFMAQVMAVQGERIYETVLAMVAAARQIAPKDVPRP